MKHLMLFFILLIHASLVAAQSGTCACCSAKHSEFDFWLDEWSVTNKDGSAAGQNSILKIQDNCVLRENWVSAKGNFTGTSYSFYNLTTKRWQQIWIDNQGGNLALFGNRLNNKMSLRSNDATNAKGKTFYNQISWTANEDGSVRQLWETFTEGADTKIAFDGLYQPAAPFGSKD